MAPRLCWRLEGRLFVAVHARENPTNLEWSGYVRTAREALGHGDVRVVVFSHGGGPDGLQREQLMRELGGRPSPTALLTSSRIVRGLVNALNVFNPRMRALGIDECEEACAFLGLTSAEHKRVLALRWECEVDLGILAEGAASTGLK